MSGILLFLIIFDAVIKSDRRRERICSKCTQNREQTGFWTRLPRRI